MQRGDHPPVPFRDVLLVFSVVPTRNRGEDLSNPQGLNSAQTGIIYFRRAHTRGGQTTDFCPGLRRRGLASASLSQFAPTRDDGEDAHHPPAPIRFGRPTRGVKEEEEPTNSSSRWLL